MSRFSIDPPDEDRYADSLYVVCAHCSTAFAWTFEDDPPVDVLCGPCWFTRGDCYCRNVGS